MSSAAWAPIIGAAASVGAAVGATWVGRKRPTKASTPEGAAILVGASMDLVESHVLLRKGLADDNAVLRGEMARMKEDLLQLRKRIEHLESIERRYRARFGPLPIELE